MRVGGRGRRGCWLLCSALLSPSLSLNRSVARAACRVNGVRLSRQVKLISKGLLGATANQSFGIFKFSRYLITILFYQLLLLVHIRLHVAGSGSLVSVEYKVP